jgi:hypothetical protein
MRPTTTPLLARSPQGEAHYCACKDRVALQFKDRWFFFEPGGLAGFRKELERLLRNPVLTAKLVDEAISEAARRGAPPEGLPSVRDLHEMLGLVDTALLVLDAQSIVKGA